MATQAETAAALISAEVERRCAAEESLRIMAEANLRKVASDFSLSSLTAEVVSAEAAAAASKSGVVVAEGAGEFKYLFHDIV